MNGVFRTHVAALGVLCAAATTAWGLEESPAVPSGTALTLQDVREETQPDGTVWLRIRYVAPGITRENRADIQDDFQALCLSQAVPHRPVTRMAVSQAVISIAAAPVEFGVQTPDVAQFFEAFRIENDQCIWEEF